MIYFVSLYLAYHIQSLEDTMYQALKNKMKLRLKFSGSHNWFFQNDGLIDFYTLHGEIQK
jgi:hypothetical protein